MTYHLIISHFVIGILSEKHLCEVHFWMKRVLESHLIFFIKLGLSEKDTKFEKNLPHGFDVYCLSKCTKHEEDCANFCLLLKKSEL